MPIIAVSNPKGGEGGARPPCSFFAGVLALIWRAIVRMAYPPQDQAQ